MQGKRLGSAADEYGSGAAPAAMTSASRSKDDMPEPAYDPSLTDGERATIRADRAAAAEARLQKQAGIGKKKKPNPDAQPMRGPNSEPLMRWTS